MKALPTVRQLNTFYLFTLGIILVTAAFLRLYGWNTMPYQHDELSALSRLNFSSWSDLFSQGIMVDGHPALVQSFLYAWTGLVGTSEWIVKLPFVICGIYAVYLTWKLVYAWSSPIGALYAAAFMAVLQLPVFHSLHARPYAPGMMLILWFALEWTRMLNAEKISRWLYVRYIAAALLCALCHHFTAMGAVLLGLCGFILLKRTQYKSYFIANGIVVLLYLPYLPITLAQLKYGGLGGDNGWLTTPESSFAIQYLAHVFMYSSPLVIILLLSVILHNWKAEKPDRTQLRIRIVAVLLFILPLFIGLYYSWIVSPILQFSLLVFFIPFLFAFMFYGNGNTIGFKWHSILVGVILIFGSVVLFKNRQYEQMAHTSVFRDAFTVTNETIKENRLDLKNGMFVFNENDHYLGFYNHGPEKLSFVSYLDRDDACQAFCAELEKRNPAYVILANPGSPLLNIVMQRYSEIYVLKQSFNCEIYYAGNELIGYAHRFKHERKHDVFTNGKMVNSLRDIVVINERMNDTIANEFDLGIKANGSLARYIDWVEFHYVIEIADSIENMPSIVYDQTLSENKNVWRSFDLCRYKRTDGIHLIQLVRGSEITVDQKAYTQNWFQVYLWNRHKQPYTIKEMYLKIYTGNRLMYAVSSEIPD